ncbi:MAG: glutamate 5-kinase [Alkalispirochaetaceae bacterium]
MRNFTEVKRIVIKVGTSLLTSPEGIDKRYIESLAAQIAEVRGSSREVLLVSSGAIGLGARELGIKGRVQEIRMRQACAAIGQPILMNTYKGIFKALGIETAQVLLTKEVLNQRRSYVNLQNSVETLLELSVLPIINENDCVATDEIGTAFGDNDRLSALVASKVDADLLMILSDIDALYDRDPRRHREARRIHSVDMLTPELINSAGRAGSVLGTGGMATKLQAVRVAENAGCQVLIANGREDRVLERLLAGEELGTLFLAKRRLKNRSRWILNSEAKGRITVDPGAMEAIRRHNSLLPTGVTQVEGVFAAGEVVLVNDRVKVVTSFDSSELRSLIGKHSSEAASIVGDNRKLIARPEDMVFLDEEEG